MNWKALLLPGLLLCASIPANAEQKAAPELKGSAAAGVEGVNAERLVFEHFKSSPEGIFNVVRLTLQPGRSIPMHSHSGPEFHVITAGEVLETLENGETKTLKVGDWHYVPAGRAHGLANKGSAPAIVIAFISGRQGEQLTSPFKSK